MTGTYEAFKTDRGLESKGLTLELGNAGTFIVARAGGKNARYAKRLDALTRKHRRAINSQTLPEDVSEDILAQVYAETVVLDWSGVTDPEGEELKFSVENARQLFKDLPDLFTAIRETASDYSVFRSAGLEEDAGNS